MTIYLALALLSLHALSQPDSSGPAGRDSGNIRIDGATLHWVAEGTGQPCLVIGSSVYYPRTFSAGIRNHLRMYFVDLRWFARIHGMIDPETYSITRLVAEIEAVRSALHLEKPLLLGHSIHGTIAMEYAKRHPEKISGLLMIGSPNYFGNKEYDDATTDAWKNASEGRKQKMDSNWKQIAAAGFLTGEQQIIGEYCLMSPKYWRDSSYDAHWLWQDVSIDARLLRYIYSDVFANYRMFDGKAALPVRTMVAVGRFDFIVPAQMWERQKHLSGLTVEIFENSGHTPQLEEPEAFDRAVVDWIKK